MIEAAHLRRSRAWLERPKAAGRLCRPPTLA
jgi:hypothetical protein